MGKIVNNIKFLLKVLVCMAWRVHLFPFRTQKLSSTASMVLRGFTWESRYMPRLWGEIVVYGPRLIRHSFHILPIVIFYFLDRIFLPFFLLARPRSSVEEQQPSKLKVTGSIPVAGTIVPLRLLPDTSTFFFLRDFDYLWDILESFIWIISSVG